MQIDAKELRQLVAYVLQTFRQMEQELLAYQIVVLGIRKSELIGDELDKLLNSARECPELQEHLREKYDAPMARIAELIEAECAAEEGLGLLRNYKPPNGPVQ